MRIIMISDNHNQYDGLTIPDGDVLIHAGDYSGMSTTEELIAFNVWLGKQPCDYKFFVAGNHDRIFETDFSFARGLLTNAITLMDTAFEYKGVNFFGTSWQPEFCNWAFNVASSNKRAKLFEKIPEKTNVLITHCPPAGILDKLESGEHCGDTALAARIRMLPNLKLNVFGHVHRNHGTLKRGGITFVNCSIVDDAYAPKYKAVIVEV